MLQPLLLVLVPLLHGTDLEGNSRGPFAPQQSKGSERTCPGRRPYAQASCPPSLPPACSLTCPAFIPVTERLPEYRFEGLDCVAAGAACCLLVPPCLCQTPHLWRVCSSHGWLRPAGT